VTTQTGDRTPHIGTLNEKPLHAALKRWAEEEGDRFEVPVGRFVADIVRGDQIIEIQTGSTSVLKRKLSVLLGRGAVRLLLPVTALKVITTLDETGAEIRSRRSPMRGSPFDAFHELVNLRTFLGDPNFSIDVVLIHEEEVRRPRSDRKTRRRQKDWEVHERRLIEVVDSVSLHHPADYLAFVPASLDEPFTTADLARAIDRPRWMARKIAYVLREMDVLVAVGKQGNAILYEKNFGGRPDPSE
jgi:hypothetical protein